MARLAFSLPGPVTERVSTFIPFIPRISPARYSRSSPQPLASSPRVLRAFFPTVPDCSKNRPWTVYGPPTVLYLYLV